MKQPLIIAIDGPAASGKGTIGRMIAQHYGAAYLDTGRLYRATAKAFTDAYGQQALSQLKNEEYITKAAQCAAKLQPHQINADGITSEQVGRAASIISAIGAVRSALLQYQRDFAQSPQGAVLDGRDIGTVVCPDAHVKLFITASLEARAKRRYKQLQSSQKGVIYDDVLRDIKARDARDEGRSTAPLLRAQDAHLIDSTEVDIDSALTQAIDIIEKHKPCI